MIPARAGFGQDCKYGGKEPFAVRGNFLGATALQT